MRVKGFQTLLKETLLKELVPKGIVLKEIVLKEVELIKVINKRLHVTMEQGSSNADEDALSFNCSQMIRRLLPSGTGTACIIGLLASNE